MKFHVLIAALVFIGIPGICPQSGHAAIYQEESVSLLIHEGRTLIAKVRKFPGATPGERLPAVLIFGGFQNAGRVLDLFQPKDPIIVASFDYPFDPPRKFRFPGSLKYAPIAKRMVGETVSGIHELRKLLAKRPDVDPARITIIGASLGAPFAVAAGATDPGISGVVVVHGFGDVPGTIQHQFMRAWKPHLGPLALVPSWLIGKLAWFYLDQPSPEEYARNFGPSQRVLMISAGADSFIPAKSSERLWESIVSSRALKERLVMPGDHLQPGSGQLIGKILDLVTVWMKKTKLL